MKSTFLLLLAVFGIGLTLNTARADETDEFIQQVIALASQSAPDADSAAQIQKTVNDNRNLITTIFHTYRSHLDQIQTLANGDDSSVDLGKFSNNARTNENATQPENSGPVSVSTSFTSGLQTSRLQPSGKLQTSGSLEGAHLSGYPALPSSGAPVSSISEPTAAQLEQGKQVDALLRQQKLFYMQHPSRSQP